MTTAMEAANPSYNRLQNIRIESVPTIDEILLCDDSQCFNHIMHIVAKCHMSNKLYEANDWHAYFRTIAANPIVFYQNNADIFYKDCQYENEQFQGVEPIFIHDNLHVGQFHYFLDELIGERIFSVRRHKKTLGSFIWDLKRLATSLALIAYYQCFSDIEMIEILDIFSQQYINSVLSSYKTKLRENQIENDQLYRNKTFRLEKQYSVIGSLEVQREMHEINWQSINSVKNLMILAEQLAITTVDLHCRSPRGIFLQKEIQEKNVDYCARTIQTVLSSIIQQQQLIEEIRSFTMTYTEIVERDYRLFFKKFRNEKVFNGVGILKYTKIPRLLAEACRVPILIIGGGIGGLATALSFARAGIRVRLLEKHSEFKEVGAGMQLAPNCSRLLDRLDILQQVQVNAVFPKQIVWMDALSGERLTCIDLGAKFIETFGYPYIVVHRADLLQALYQACLESSMVKIEVNRTVISVDERPKSIMVECADGMRYNCDMVVAADGLWSSLRKFVCDDGPPISVGYVTYRGTVAIDQVSKQAGLENVQFWIGPDLHLVQYPIRRSELFNQAAVFKSHQLPDDTDQWGTKQELYERFSIGCQHVKNALKLLHTNFRYPVYDRNPLSKWSRSRLVLLGDAAHPMLQYAAQGAAQAIEDACALVAAYKKYGPSNIDHVFREYEQERIPRSSKVVQYARDIGIFAHHNGMAKIVRDAILGMHDTNDFDFLKWLYAEKQYKNE